MSAADVMKHLALVLLASALISCECDRSASGTVVDDSTNLPLDSVHVRSFYADIAEENETYYIMTDSTGRFTANNVHSGAANCDLYVTFAREGYKAAQLHNPKSAEVVRLTK